MAVIGDPAPHPILSFHDVGPGHPRFLVWPTIETGQVPDYQLDDGEITLDQNVKRHGFLGLHRVVVELLIDLAKVNSA